MGDHLVVLGCGYSGLAVARGFAGAVSGSVRSTVKAAHLAGYGIAPLLFSGKADAALKAAIASATHVLVSIPPDETGDPALEDLYEDLLAAPVLRWIGYLSTVGVYGDFGGAWIDETTPPRPTSKRGQWRVAAENAWLALGAKKACPVQLFRLAGIYGPGRNTFINLAAGKSKRIIKPGQVFNRIHVEDIAGLVLAGMAHPQAGPILNGADDEPCPPQDAITHAAALMGVAPPPAQDFATADMTPMARSFYGENKRVSNAATKAALGYTFRYPTYREGLGALAQARDWEREPPMDA